MANHHLNLICGIPLSCRPERKAKLYYDKSPNSEPYPNARRRLSIVFLLKSITSFVNVRAQYCLIKLPPFACMFCILRADTTLSLHARRRKRNSCNRVFSLELPSPNSCTRKSSLVPSFIIKV